MPESGDRSPGPDAGPPSWTSCPSPAPAAAAAFYEAKYDGYRAVAYIGERWVRLESCRGAPTTAGCWAWSAAPAACIRSRAADVAALLRPAEDAHPWPELLPPGWAAGLFRRADPVAYVRVEPEPVVEVPADLAREHGRWRHPLRYLRPRPDMCRGAVPRGTAMKYI
ncbi:hypothetical protein [Sinosporangium siamense]|uniref:Uncharacterized protein n=1 Tax=Sinosporangium siamense TaxID=1367973 RepID=A0A919V9N1_9ACTN|nr:hypothetical protein [Sinosporangium siamense]GII94487.1 hypothetical protein Ssi02_47180 [Sinosporangium siamense]